MKRLFDVVVALLALIVLSPVLAIVICLIAVRIGRPVLFKQDRPGRDGHAFTIYKFRTMTDVRDDRGALLSDD